MDRSAAHLGAFTLLEAVQGEGHEEAFASIGRLSLEAFAWPEVLFLYEAARTVHAIVHPADEVDPEPLVAQLLGDALDPAATAIALGLKGILCASTGDPAALIAHTSRAIALLDDDTLPPRERCLAYVICAAALNTLRLWELTDELYARALVDPRAAREAGQSAAVAINRVVIGLEHSMALIEYGDDSAARLRLRQTQALVPLALEQELPPLFRQDALAAHDVVQLLLGEPTAIPVAAHLTALRALNDVEVLPHLEAAIALTTGSLDELPAVSASSGIRTFPLWVRAQVLSRHEPSAAVEAQQAHAHLVNALLWESRSAVLSAAQAQIASERREAEVTRLERAVHTDSLTGLHNRRRFDDWLQRPGGGATALLMLDLDDFKKINDEYGHGCGDEVLRRVGQLLRSSVRPGDLAVRQGGDEFAVVLHGLDLTPEIALSRADAVARIIAEEPWSEVAVGLTVRASIGAALAYVEPGQVAGPALYRSADAALYRAKREGLPPVLADTIGLPVNVSAADAGEG